jgi:membrane protein DedA with SNARE-associated domain
VVIIETITDFLREYWTALQTGQAPPLGYWNYLILMVFVILQGPSVALLSGVGVSAGIFNPFLAGAASITGSLLADIFWYQIGLLGKLERYYKQRSNKRQKLVELFYKGMRKHYLKVLLLGKLSIGLAIPAVISAGLCRIKWRRWFPIVIIGEIGFTAVMITLGYFATESITHVDKYIKAAGISVTVICLVILIIVIPIEIKKLLSTENGQTE